MADEGDDEKAAVIDLRDKRVEKMGEEIQSLGRAMSSALDEQVGHLVGQYHEWERAHPDEALKPHHKLAMVRYGFIGPGGYVRCHEAGRLPEVAFISDDGVSEEIERDYDAAEVLMCPAMESRRCEGVWRGMQMPPCYLLLLEVHRGLGGGAIDDSVQEVLDDVGCWEGPEQKAKSFARARAILKKHGYS